MLKIPLLYLSGKLNSFFQLPRVQRWGAKYPRFFSFLIRRFDLEDFLGLPLTFLLVIIGVNLFLLSGLAENVINSPTVKALDREVTVWFFKRRSPFLSQALFYYTQLASRNGITLLTTAAGIFFLIRRKGRYLLGLLLAVLGSSLSVNLLKLFFHRERPLAFFYYPETSFSFPSGHATGAMALAGILCYYMLVESRSSLAQVSSLGAALIFTLLMGFSRIYLGVHFLTDVAAGYLVGLLWVLLSIGMMEFLALKKPGR